DKTATTNNMTIDKDSKKIQIKLGTSGLTTLDNAAIANEINTKLDSWGLSDVEIDTTTFKLPALGAITGSVKVPSDGKDLLAPKSVNIAEGMTIKLPKGKSFNNVEVQIGSLDAVDSNGKALDPVIIEPKPVPLGGQVTKIIINGDFRDQNVDSTTLENEINKAIEACGVYGTGTLTDNQKVTVSGSAKPIKGLNSSEISGGLEFESPGNQIVFGFDFEFGNGESLNGYKINIGQITSGTKTSAAIDEKSKTITINGDFVTAGKVTAESLRNILNSALSEKGIDQTIKVSGNADTLGSVESDETLGGTPVNSMNTDGTINFVDATGDLKSYDGELKTLRIPDKVRIPGTDQELRVKTYTIDKSGVINGVLEDGRVAALGQIAMASFKNPEGLSKLGGNLYSSSVNSGGAVIKTGVGTLGDDNSKGYGDNLQGMLEMSNVDLAEQFTDMIVSSRAFQAAGKMITTGDEILQDIINLKR
ncbi:MAG: flagellar hook-basal body complex protein, partial [Paraclostridium sp.]